MKLKATANKKNLSIYQRKQKTQLTSLKSYFMLKLAQIMLEVVNNQEKMFRKKI